MKPARKPFVTKMVFGVSYLFVLFCLSQNASAANIIAGTIFDKARNPLADIDIELLDEYQRVIPNGRQKTTSSGRYEFSVSNSGRYYIRVYAFRYDLMDDTRMIEISAVSALPGQGGSSYNLEDFYLQPKKGGLRDAELSVIFAQDVPKEAERIYKKALDDFSKKRSDEGFASLQESIRLFPTYYAALQRLGMELFLRKQYMDAAQAYLKAAEINPKSAMSYYYVGYALHSLGEKYNKSALTALNEAVKLAPASTPVLLLIGTIERAMGKFAEAEKHLLQAKKLSPSKVPEIQKELAQLYANDLKKYKEAADELEQYVKASKLSDADEAKTKQLIADLRVKALKTQTGN
jgi:tetratricopeptide (TPR) repeat protein